jgi:hypothetical protein
MTSIIRSRADRLATFRSISVQLMELLARWVPTTPEMEAKVLFGRHVWDFAQHADMLGKRTFELRAPLHYTLPPAADYQRLLTEVAAATATNERIALLYRGFLPGLARRYGDYLETADPLLDEPSVRIIERICTDLARLLKEGRELTADFPQFGQADRVHIVELTNREMTVRTIVASDGGERRRSA